MKVLIVGSLDQEHDTVDEEKEALATAAKVEQDNFVSACRQIGVAFANDKRAIIVGSVKEGTADRYVLEGMNSVAGKHTVIVVLPDDGRTAPNASEFPNLTFTSRRRGQNWTVARAFQIKEADVVVAIGGGSGTLQAGLMAPALEKPTLAVRAFPGAARELWSTFRSDYERADISGRDIGLLEETQWTAETAEVVTRSALCLVKRNPYHVNQIPILLGLMAIVLAMMAGWITLFLNPNWLPVSDPASKFSYATFILLGLAAFLGSGMRTALPMLEGRVVALMQLVSEMIVGIFLAFGFMLIYLASGILIVGQVNIDAEGFRNAAVTTSLMGFAVAFFAERAANKLREQLGERL